MSINLIEYFEDTVLKFSSKIAVIEKERKVSFGELAEKSKVLSTSILRKVNVINQPIAIYLPKSIEAIVADIACTYSGNMYMNLDVKTPSERIRNILDLIQPKVIITNHQYLKNISEIIPSGMEVINLDEMEGEIDIDEALIKSKWQSLIDTDPLCIINTSGSTGTPKGVVLNHRSFQDFIARSLESFQFSENEMIGSLSPLVFDIYSFELCMLMVKSSTIVIIPDGLSAFPITILKLMQEQKISFIFWVPTIMVNIANMNLFASIQLPDLKTVWFAGEVFPTKQFNYWQSHLPHTLFANLYGPIEITLDCTYYVINREIKDEEPIPIGYAYKNTDILILNDKNDKTKQGEEGELCVRGTSLAMGYYNNPEKTAAAFVQNPLNHSYPEIIYRTGDLVYVNARGEIVFKGRKDSLIKHLGYRIELGEIEHVIVNQLKLVKNCCVVYHREKKEITLFYEADNELTAAEFRIAIGKELPKYMIPTVYYRLDELQRNTNGKIDRLFYNKEINC
ncbi:MAG: amino acid adenylation domain-containing protein [Anaerovoracaceae bacterium]